MAARQMTPPISEAVQRVGALPAAPQQLRLAGRAVPVVGTGRLYVCGITPYDVTHLGHAATFVWADVLASVIGLTGASVRTCRNITDVDDVLLAAASQRGAHFDEFALIQEASFDRSMASLQVADPAEAPRARHYVDAVIHLAAALLESDAAYELDGTVWFRGGDVVERSGLSRAQAWELAQAYGDDPGEPAKADPFDVEVWRPSLDGQPAWASPWGWGRPGWHAECAAMALGVLGSSVDVLAGGADLVFPHHAYQSAIVEAASGVTPFARATLHVGEVRVAGDKMAKSAGNLVLVDDLLTEVPPATLRLHLLNRSYADPWDFDMRELSHTQEILDGLYVAAGSGEGSSDAADAPGLLEIREALYTDLDVPLAIERALGTGGRAARSLIAWLRLG